MSKWRPIYRPLYMRSRIEAIWEGHSALEDKPGVEDKRWLETEGLRVTCPRVPHHRSREWKDAPAPIDLVLPRVIDEDLFYTDKVSVLVLRASLYKVLKPWMRHMLIGTVKQSPGKSNTLRSDKLLKEWVTVNAYPRDWIDPYRAQNCFHTQCKGCGLYDSAHSAAIGIVERSLGSHRVWCATSGSIWIDDSLCRELDLRAKFPNLAFVRCKVIEAPLDGDVLPGDPGWNGKFKPQTKAIKKHNKEINDWIRKLGN